MLVLGRVGAPFGVQGWVRVHPFADDPKAWASVPAWFLAPDPDLAPDGWRQVRLEQARLHGDGLIAKFADVTGRSAAEAIDGLYVGLPRESMPEPATDEYYWSDLVGLEVINQHGQSLGRVAGLIDTGANEVLRVQEGNTERLLPFIAAVVREVRVEAGTIRVDWEADW
jgi:16S rRNA processing protein RimM